MKYLIPEMEAINIEISSFIKKLGLDNLDEAKGRGKAFEAVCHSWICNKQIENFKEDDVDGNLEFGIDSINIEQKKEGRFAIKILNCKSSGGFSYKHVEEIKKGLKIIFENDNYQGIKNYKLKQKIEETRKKALEIEEIKIYYCVNTNLVPDDECVSSKDELLEEIRRIFESKYKVKNADFLFLNAKEIYEKKIRNDNSLSKRGGILLKYNEGINDFAPDKKIDTSKGEIRGCVVTVDAIELKKMINNCGDEIFHYNIRKFKGKNYVNDKIGSTIKSDIKNIFWFLNNGITLVCEDAIKTRKGSIELYYPQVVNGLQTLKKIESFTDDELTGIDVLTRICITNNEEIFSNIALATNSQSRIDFSDMSSNKTEQQAIKIIFENYSYYYKNKKGKEEKKYKTGVNSKLLGRISLATINKKPTMGRKIVRDSIIFSEDYYDKLFNVNPLLLLLSFLVYNFCQEKYLYSKKIKEVLQNQEIKNFGIFHLACLIWENIEKQKKISQRDKIIKLIVANDFNDFYKEAYLKIEKIINQEKLLNDQIMLKDFFNDEKLDNLIFK